MLTRLFRSLTTLPSAAEWRLCAAISAATLLGIGLCAYNLGLIHWLPRTDSWGMRLIGSMLVPAFTEELVFRGLLIPARGESRHAVRWFAGGVLVFILWHIVEALTILPGATLFLQPAFLLCAGLLGTACAYMRYRTGSLWPAVVLHGLLVFGWQTFFGGPDVTELLQR
jgi:predicted Abi (CAAX) family protease